MDDADWPFDRQCVLRLPEDLAERLHSDLGGASSQEKDIDLSIKAHPQSHAKDDVDTKAANADPLRYYLVHVFGEKLHGVLVDFPCHAETHKTWDGVHMFKSGDVSQMLIAYRAQEGPPVELRELLASDSSYVGLQWPHGVCPAPVTHRIRQKRFVNENDLKYEDIADGEKVILDCLAEKEVTVLEQDIVTMADYRRHLRDWQENPLETNPIWKKSEEIGAGDRGARSPSASGSGVDLQDDDGSAVSGPAGISSAPPSGVGAPSRAKSSKQAVDHFKAMMEMDDSDDESIPASGAESSGVDNNDEAGESSAEPAKPSNIWEWRSY